MTAASSIEASNSGEYDLHLALHSNAAGGDLVGTLTGIDIYYSPASVQGQRAAELIQTQLQKIYPNPELVKIVPTTTLGEVTTICPTLSGFKHICMKSPAVWQLP